MKATTTIRVTCKSLRIFRKHFKAQRGEKVIDYIDRLSEHFEELKGGNENGN